MSTSSSRIKLVISRYGGPVYAEWAAQKDTIGAQRNCIFRFVTEDTLNQTTFFAGKALHIVVSYILHS